MDGVGLSPSLGETHRRQDEFLYPTGFLEEPEQIQSEEWTPWVDLCRVYIGHGAHVPFNDGISDIRDSGCSCRFNDFKKYPA